MKIELTRGCTSYGVDVDGKDFFDLSKQEKDFVIDKVAERIKKDLERGSICIFSIMDIFQSDESKDLGYCEQCNDNIESEIVYL